MNPNDPARHSPSEETADWPVGNHRPLGTPRDEESTRPAPATSRNAPPPQPQPQPQPQPRSIHEENTLDAGQFIRSQQAPPPPPGQAPGWPGAPAGYPQPPQAGPGGNPPPYPPPNAWPTGYQRPPTVIPRAKPSLVSRLAEHRWWLIGGAAAIAVVLVIALIVAGGGDDTASNDGPPTSPAQVPAGPTTTVPATPTAAPSAPPAPPPGPVIAAEALPGLLLPADQINQRMNTSGMAALPTEHAPLAGTVTPPHCTGVWGPVYEATYNGSGYTGLAVQGVHREPSHKVAQAVVAFPDPGAAQAFYDRQVADWNACKSSHIRFEFNGSTEVDVGVPAVTAGVMTVMLFPTTSRTAGQQCERDMTVRGNVIVDVRACSPTVGSAGLSIATAIADKIAPAA